MTPEEQLRARPTFEQAGQNYITTLQEMQRTISTLVPGLTWAGPPPGLKSGGSFCEAPYTDVPGARSGDYLAGAGDKPFPDESWPQISTALTDIARRHGFTKVTMKVDQPGRHEVEIADQYGASVTFGSIGSTSVAVFGACFLDAAHHAQPSSSG